MRTQIRKFQFSGFRSKFQHSGTHLFGKFTSTRSQVFQLSKSVKTTNFRKKQYGTTYGFTSKIDLLQIPPSGADFLWFLQKSTLIGRFLKKHVFFNFFQYFKFQKVSKMTFFYVQIGCQGACCAFSKVSNLPLLNNDIFEFPEFWFSSEFLSDIFD